MPVLEGVLDKMPSGGSRTDATAWRSRYMICTVRADGGSAELSWFKGASADGKPKGTLYINAGTTVVPVLCVQAGLEP